jgi:hypothetical protein
MHAAGRHRYRRIATLREILDRGRRAWSPVASASACTVVFTDGPTGVAHHVTEEAFGAGRAGVVTLPSVVRRCSPRASLLRRFSAVRCASGVSDGLVPALDR